MPLTDHMADIGQESRKEQAGDAVTRPQAIARLHVEGELNKLLEASM
jgi:hypothetical protein